MGGLLSQRKGGGKLDFFFLFFVSCVSHLCLFVYSIFHKCVSLRGEDALYKQIAVFMMMKLTSLLSKFIFIWVLLDPHPIICLGSDFPSLIFHSKSCQCEGKFGYIYTHFENGNWKAEKQFFSLPKWKCTWINIRYRWPFFLYLTWSYVYRVKTITKAVFSDNARKPFVQNW